MASKMDNSSTFRAVAGFAAFLLVAAAALTYMQGGDGNPSAPKLAALSQAVPTLAARALDGDSSAFAELDKHLKSVARLRRGGAPGRSSDWQQLESRAAAILAKRAEVETVLGAAAQTDKFRPYAHGHLSLLAGQPA